MSVFTKVKLSDGREAIIREANGIDLFNASSASNGNSGAMPYYLLVSLTSINGKQMEGINELALINPVDTLAIMDAILPQIVKPGYL